MVCLRAGVDEGRGGLRGNCSDILFQPDGARPRANRDARPTLRKSTPRFDQSIGSVALRGWFQPAKLS